ncbi:MAG TPA: glycosyl hydrolase [Tepidisphaeraceae bacterium]|jgi:hypothetical protein
MAIALATGAICLTGSRASGADSNTLMGIHFWGDRNDSAPATLMDSVNRGGYDLEIVNTGNPEWNDVDVVQPLYDNFKNTYKVTPITRLGYYWGNTLPVPGTAAATNWSSTIASNVVSRLKDTAHLWQLGNEPNLHGEAQGWVNQQITPQQYATVYQNVRAAINAPSLLGQAGAHKLLVAPVSPGGVAGDRWMDGAQWLDQTLAAIPAHQVDGIALHAYGGGGNARQAFGGFYKSLVDQITAIDARGLTNVPLYITEWNRATQIGNLADEATTAAFSKQVFQFLNRWNNTAGNHNIVASTWFVYDGGNGSGTWDTYSIEYWKNFGNGAGSPNSMYQAFYDTSRTNLKSGVAGTKALAPFVKVFDDFENGATDHFSGATPAPSGSGATSGTTSGSFKVRTNDTDSFTKGYAHKIGIVDDPNNANGWSARYLSNGGNPSSETTINLTSGVDGFIGFYLRLFTYGGSEDVSSAAGLTAQLVLDSGSGGGVNTDAGKPLTVFADSQWHFYQWNLDNPADWVPYAPATGSDGKLGTGANFLGQVSIDSIVFNGGNVNVEYLLDTVAYNPYGGMDVFTGLPEPGTVSLVCMGMLGMTRRRRCN